MSNLPSGSLARLRSLVEIETPTGDGDAIRRLQLAVVDTLTALGASVSWQRHPLGDHVVCTMPGRGVKADLEPVLILLHADTVWPLGQLAAMPWRVEDGVVFGPGVYDMKGGIVVVEQALERIRDSAHRPLIVALVADEEIGSPTAASLIESLAGKVHAVLGFEPPHPDGALKTSRWGSTRVRLCVTGREAHAALDAASGISAIDELVDQLLEVRRITAGRSDVLCNVGTVAGGGRTNVVPAEASAEIGLRFQNGAIEREVLDVLASLTPVRAGARVSVEVISRRPAWGPGAVHDELLARIAQIAADSGTAVAGRPALGAADTNLTGHLGVPSVDGLGPVGQGAHARHEQILASTLDERSELVARILAEL